MSIINSQKFKHRKRVATEAQSMSLLTETSTKSIIQPYEAKKKPYRYLQIDTIKEFGASKSHSKSLSRNYHPSSQSLRIHKMKSILSIPAGKSLRYAQQKSDDEKNANESDRCLNGGISDKQMRRRKLRQRLERAESESRAEMRARICNLQEQFTKLRDAIHSIGTTIKNDIRQSSLLSFRNRNASVRIIVRRCTRIQQGNMSSFFEKLLQT